MNRPVTYCSNCPHEVDDHVEGKCMRYPEDGGTVEQKHCPCPGLRAETMARPSSRAVTILVGSLPTLSTT